MPKMGTVLVEKEDSVTLHRVQERMVKRPAAKSLIRIVVIGEGKITEVRMLRADAAVTVDM